MPKTTLTPKGQPWGNYCFLTNFWLWTRRLRIIFFAFSSWQNLRKSYRHCLERSWKGICWSSSFKVIQERSWWIGTGKIIETIYITTASILYFLISQSKDRMRSKILDAFKLLDWLVKVVKWWFIFGLLWLNKFRIHNYGAWKDKTEL